MLVHSAYTLMLTDTTLDLKNALLNVEINITIIYK